MDKKNSFCYKIIGGSTSGYFNIYQSRGGKICLQMGDSVTALTLKQINELSICCYDLDDFDIDSFHTAYKKNTTLVLSNIKQFKDSSTTYMCDWFTYQGKEYNKISIDDYSNHSDIYIDDNDTCIGTIDKNIFDIIDSKTNIVTLNYN